MKKLLTILLSIIILISSTSTVLADDTATLTVDFNGGTVSPNGIPAGWTDLGEGKYCKDYPLNESVYLDDEWSDYKPIKPEHEFYQWQDDNYAYFNGFSMTEDITVKAVYKGYLYVVMDLKGGTIPDTSVPSGWEKVSGHDDQYRKKFLEGTYYWDVESDWGGVIPQYNEASGIGFVEWDYPEWFDLQDDNSVIEAKTDVLLNVVLDLKGGTFSAGSVPSGWIKDSLQDDKYIKKYVKGTSAWVIKYEIENVVPQYSEASGKGFVSWDDPEWYYLEDDNSVIEAETGTLRIVTVDFDGGVILSAPSSWAQDLSDTDKYTKKYPVGYSTSTIYSEILSSFSIKSFDGNKFFIDSLDYDYSIWEVPDDDTLLFTAKYENAISLTIDIPSNGIIIVNDEQKNSSYTINVPASTSASFYNGVLNISCYAPTINYRVEAYGSAGYELDYFTYNGAQCDSYVSPLSDGDSFSAVMKEGSQQYPVWIDGVAFSEGNTTMLEGTVSYNPTTRVLTLDGANINFSSPTGIAFATSITINVVSDSSITAVESGDSKCAIAGIYNESGVGTSDSPLNASNLTISGNGKLTINLKKTDGADFSHTTCVEGIFANKIVLSTDVEIISDKVNNGAYNGAMFYGINAGIDNGITINNGKILTVNVKSVSSGNGMPNCDLISGPLTIEDNATVNMSVGSFSSYNKPAFASGTKLIAGTVSISANPAGDINLYQAANLMTIEGATAGATSADTSFTQANPSNPLILSTKNLVVVEGVNMTKTEFKSNETVEYSGSPSAKKMNDSTDVTSQIDNWNYTYYKENSGSWSKLSSTPNDEGSYKLVVEANDSEYFGTLELPFTIVHAHSFTYAVNSENDAQLIATCSGTNCEYHSTPLTLTLTAPSPENLVYNEMAKEVNFANGETNIWETETGNDVPTIEYYLEDGTTKTNVTNSGASAEGLAPKFVGTYNAKVTVDSNKTAILEYSITPKEYQITAGTNSEWKKGSTEGLTITSSAPYNEFVCVKVDDSQIDDLNYTVEEGSTIVTLKKSYLETLSIGGHFFEIVSKNGNGLTTFKIVNNISPSISPSRYNIPNTGIDGLIISNSGNSLLR